MELDFLQGEKLAILGYGREGKSLARFFAARGINFSVLDKSPELPDIPPDAPRTPGPDYLSRAADYGLIFRSPGVKRSEPGLADAERKGVKISSLTKLFFTLCPCPIIGITGTKGKGTTASLVKEILAADGRKVFLGGNIGITPLDFLPDLTQDSVVVLELSSFQLQDLDKSPRYACVLNFFPDHLDYHTSLEEYFDAKANIVLHQAPGDTAVFNAEDERIRQLAAKTKAAKYWFSNEREVEPGAFLAHDELVINSPAGEKTLCRRFDLKIRGEHNVLNALAASAVCFAAGVKIPIIKRAVINFRGLPHHRLEYAGSVGRVAFYNDSFATIPEATIAALSAFDKRVVLILGGSDKRLGYQGLAKAVTSARIGAVVLMGQTGKEIKRCLEAQKYAGKYREAGGSMEETVLCAYHEAGAGGVVLFSPAAASFDMFRNAAERGESFMAAVKTLKNAQEKKRF